jgi:hypothetical protein
VFKRGVSPSSFSSLSPFKERGIKGVRSVNIVPLVIASRYA